MNPVLIVEAATLAIQGGLQIIAEIHGQGAMTPDEIMAAAQGKGANTQALVKQYLAALPAPPPKAA